MSFMDAIIVHVCPVCGDLVCQDPVPGENDGIVCGGPLGHIVIERPERKSVVRA